MPPYDFYSSTNHRTEVFYDNTWHEVKEQRMDAVIVKDTILHCKKLRDIKKGYIQGLLSGNALAVHDLENQFFDHR